MSRKCNVGTFRQRNEISPEMGSRMTLDQEENLFRRFAVASLAPRLIRRSAGHALGRPWAWSHAHSAETPTAVGPAEPGSAHQLHGRRTPTGPPWPFVGVSP